MDEPNVRVAPMTTVLNKLSAHSAFTRTYNNVGNCDGGGRIIIAQPERDAGERKERQSFQAP